VKEERRAGCAVVQCGGKLGENPLGATSRLTLVNAQPAAAFLDNDVCVVAKSRPVCQARVGVLSCSSGQALDQSSRCSKSRRPEHPVASPSEGSGLSQEPC